MASDILNYSVTASFFTGPQPKGATLGSGQALQSDSVPPLPVVGATFTWQSGVTGKKYSGKVAFAGVADYFQTSGLVTVHLQINCVESKEI